MKISWQELPNVLNKELMPCYFILSDSRHLAVHIENQILEKIREAGFTTQYHYLIETGFNWDDFLKNIENDGLFQEKQCFCLHFLEMGLSEVAEQALMAYTKYFSGDTILLLRFDKTEKASRSNKIEKSLLHSSFFRAVEKQTIIIDVGNIKGKIFAAWLNAMVHHFSISLSPSAHALLMDACRDNPDEALQTLKRIQLHFLDEKRQLTEPEILPELPCVEKAAPYALWRIIFSGKMELLNRQIDLFKQTGLEATLALWMIMKPIRSCAEYAWKITYTACDQNVEWHVLSKQLFLNQVETQKLKKFFKHVNLSFFYGLLRQAYQLDKIIKGGRSGDFWDGLLHLCAQFTQKMA